MDQNVAINCTDSANTKVEAQVFVDRQLRINPAQLFLTRNDSSDFLVSGGTGGYTVFADSGNVNIDAKSGIGSYTAPNRLGSYNVTVEDNSGSTAILTIEVEPSDPVISPKKITMSPSSTHDFVVARGSPSYTWSFTGSKPEPFGDKQEMVGITAPEQSGEYTLTVEDQAGNQATATITVNQPLLLSPSDFLIYKDEDVTGITIHARNAVGKCNWVLNDLDFVDIDDTSISIQPRTDLLGQVYKVTCNDDAGKSISMSIIVSLLPGDSDANGKIDDMEMQELITDFFTYKDAEGGMRREDVYSHLQ